jgi:GTP-binding protein EngB required for normal cell division
MQIEEQVTKNLLSINAIQKSIKVFKTQYPENQWEPTLDTHIKNYSAFLENPSIDIAIVGTIKAGKSTLINAILDEDISSMEVTPETAALTKVKYSNQIELTITFHSTESWQELWSSIESADTRNNLFKDSYTSLGADKERDSFVGKVPMTFLPQSLEELKVLVKKYTSSQSASHYFVKEVEVGIPSCPLPPNVYLVDTPGLNDVIDYRSKVTREYINRANIILICVNSGAMRNDEFQVISEVFDNISVATKNVFVLGTQIDKLNNPIADWNKQQTEWKRYLRSLYKDDELLGRNILGVSAYINHLLDKINKDHLLTNTEMDDIVSYCRKNNIAAFNNGSLLSKISTAIRGNLPTIKANLDKAFGSTKLDGFLEYLNQNHLSEIQNLIKEEIKAKQKGLYKEIEHKLIHIIEKEKEVIETLSMSSEELEHKKEQLLTQRKTIKNESMEIAKDFDLFEQEISKALSTTRQNVDKILQGLGK